ncbi:LysM peptidoglycan-binding domain-containing protein [Neobacillus cucumis]|uniref:LysM peptidoglycan-binding domain-containing protein n=1 Tax=Neobacillus cucumis TaxID=1740721 RepID=UPI0028534B4B|nr:glycosyl hydrolase family 18 protein [Neobacillus cucumis]MDR4947292.1 glycosyl hydrolase family 18 protein [Neobacillus cucumis]
MTVHVVRTSEDLWSISKLYNVSLHSIVSANGLSSTTALTPGLALYIPDNKTPVRVYRIKAGDYPWKLAQQFNSSLSLISAANPGIDLNHLHIGQVINIPSIIKLEMSILGFLVPSAEAATLSIINSLSGQLTYLAIVNYSFTVEGFAFMGTDDSAIIAKCKQVNITPLLMIRNFSNQGFSAELAGTVLGNSTYRENLISSIVHLTTQRGFGGVSLDFEFIPPQHRTDFNVFLKELKSRLGGRLLHVNVHAKTEDLPTNRIVGAYDYAAIGNTADLVAVMTIDYGYPGGPPEPISPIKWVEQVIIYALSKLNPEKLLIAMALYGYDKVVNTKETTGLSVLAAQNQAILNRVSIEYDDSAKSPWYRYSSGTSEHVVWFEDIRSYIEKYKLIDSYHLFGTTFWQISLPAPQNWAYLSKNIVVVK